MIIEDLINMPNAMRDMIESNRRTQARFAEMTRPPRAVLEMIESTRRVQERFAEMTKPPQAVLDMIEANRQWQANVAEMIKPPKAIEDLIKSNQRLQAQLARAIELPKGVLDLEQLAHRWSSREWWTSVIYRDLDEEIEVTPSGEIVIGSETMVPEVITASLDQLVVDLAETPTADCFAHLVAFLSGLKRPLAKLILVLIGVHLDILANLVAPIYQPWWNQLTGLPPEEVATTVRELARKTYDPSQLAGRRFVTAKQLQVIVGEGPDERVIAELPLGKVVKIIETDRRLSLVEFLDETQQKFCRGWVATSFLSRFTE